jgi:hypothetical protein
MQNNHCQLPHLVPVITQEPTRYMEGTKDAMNAAYKGQIHTSTYRQYIGPRAVSSR